MVENPPCSLITRKLFELLTKVKCHSKILLMGISSIVKKILNANVSELKLHTLT